MNYTKRQRTTGLKRLLVLAGILDKADAAHRRNKEPEYRQDRAEHFCGTPACAGGHWDQSPQGVAIARREGAIFRAHARTQSVMGWCEVFRLTFAEMEEIFGQRGCGNAKTAKEAANYIRAFVKRARA